MYFGGVKIIMKCLCMFLSYTIRQMRVIVIIITIINIPVIFITIFSELPTEWS